MTTWIKGIAALSLFLFASLCLQRFRSNFSAVEVKRAGLEASEFAPEPAAEPVPDSLTTTTNGATVIARFGWQAEVLAKAAFLDEVSSDDVFSLIEELGAAALVVTEGIVLPTARWADFVVTDAT